MLKVTKLALAALAALGMSSAFSQASPGSTPSGWSYYSMPDGSTRVYAGGSPVGGFQASHSGNTTRFSYQPLPSSPPPVVPTSPSAGTYTTVKRLPGGFELEQRADLPVPGRDSKIPVALRKPLSSPSMARAIARTIPFLGNALAMKELLGEIFDKPVTFNAESNQWEITDTRIEWKSGSTGSLRFGSLAAGCVYIFSNGWSSNPSHSWTLSNVTSTTGQCVILGGDGLGIAGYNFDTTPPTEVQDPVNQEEIETAYPPVASDSSVQDALEDLLPSLPEDVRKDLAEENKGPGVSVIPQTPSGQDMTTPWQSPPSVSTRQTNDALGRPQTITSTTTTTASPVQDGLRYDTTTTSTTTTQTGTDPVTGDPITETTTDTTTTEQTSTRPAEGEDLECGLPGTPPCKIDETGTPGTDEANFDKGQEEIERFKSGLFDAVQAKLDEISHSWSFTFALPTGCAPLSFDTKVGPVVAIDMCEHQETIHSLMSMIWAAAGVFGAIAIFLRADG